MTWNAYEKELADSAFHLLGAVFCGAALALSGAAYQGVFKNPLVSPDFLGVSQGACVGAALAILLALPAGMTQLFAFLGGSWPSG